MRRGLIVGVIGTVLVVALAASVQAGSRAQRQPSAKPIQLVPRTYIPHLGKFHLRLKVNCRSLSCINHQLSQLDKRVSKQIDKLNAAVNIITNCEQLLPITQYGAPSSAIGYFYQNPGPTTILTTALDITEVGQIQQYFMVVDTCQ